MQYLSQETIDGVSADDFQRKRPYPSGNIQGPLTLEGFERLRETLPDSSLFERKAGIKRAYGQGVPAKKSIDHKEHLFPRVVAGSRGVRSGCGLLICGWCELGEGAIPSGPESSRIVADSRSKDTACSPRTILQAARRS